MGNPKVLIFMIFGRSGHDNDSQNQLCLILTLDNYFKEFKKIPEAFSKNISLGNINILDVESLENVDKDVRRKS